jgi:hypothetical protein
VNEQVCVQCDSSATVRQTGSGDERAEVMRR